MQLTAVGSSVSVTRYDQFDNLERVTKSSQASGNVSYPFEYQYQLDGTLKQFQYPSGRVVSYGFDTAGRVNAIPGYLTAVSYSDHGAVRRVSYANGILEQRCYNERLQAVRITVKAVLADQCFASYHMAFSF